MALAGQVAASARGEQRLARMTAIAKASQLALLPPLPGDDRNQHRGPLPLGDPRRVGRR
jgi:hypothetical protein